MSKTRSNTGLGRAFWFFGKFRSKILASRSERELPGSFILKRDGYYYVMKEKGRKKNPRGRRGFLCKVCGKRTIHLQYGKPIHKTCYQKLKQVTTLKPNPIGRLIYGRVLKIFAQKTDGPYRGQRFVHTFKAGARMYGMPDGSLRIVHL